MMADFIQNTWKSLDQYEIEHAKILTGESSPEGLFVSRYRWKGTCAWKVPSNGCIISVVFGSGQLVLGAKEKNPLYLTEGCHVYHPAWAGSVFHAKKGTEIVCVAASCKNQSRGKQLIVRDEQFLRMANMSNGTTRWKLTPQYLSRRIFLHHDMTLLSASGSPISWFRTTMFDVSGLPNNNDGEPVFKMSYNYRTEINVCLEVSGSARARMAKHPYEFEENTDIHRYGNGVENPVATDAMNVGCVKNHQQEWGKWEVLDGETTYHLNEAKGCKNEERVVNATTGDIRFFRNKHEVSISEGHVTLLCAFDPAPTGMEQHQPGAYSSYGPLHSILNTEQYAEFLVRQCELDAVSDKLSLWKAYGMMPDKHCSKEWHSYESGVRVQDHFEWLLLKKSESVGRDHVIRKWMRQNSHLSPPM